MSGDVDASQSRIMESPKWTGPKSPVAAMGGISTPGGGNTHD